MTSKEFELLKTKLNNAIANYYGVSFYTSTILSAIEDNLEYLQKYEIDNAIIHNSNCTDIIEVVVLRIEFIVGSNKSRIEFSYKRYGKSQDSTITTYGISENNGYSFSSSKELSKTNLIKFIREGKLSRSAKFLKHQIQNIINNYELSPDLLDNLKSLLQTLEDKEIEGELNRWSIKFENECCLIHAEFECSPTVNIEIKM